MNQGFYRSTEWKRIRNQVILRDNGCDLGVEGFEIPDKVIIHHMNPIIQNDIRDMTEYLTNPEYLICTSHKSHNAIHYGLEEHIQTGPVIRTKNDTCPWKR